MSDLFNSRGTWSKGEGYFQNLGGSWLKGELKNSGGGGAFGPWMKLCIFDEML